MIFQKRDYELFMAAAKKHNLKPLLREISSVINNVPVTLYEVIGIDRVTEYIISKEMEEMRK